MFQLSSRSVLFEAYCNWECQLRGGYPTERPTDSAGHGSPNVLRMVPGPGFEEEMVDCGSTWSGHFWSTVSYNCGLIAPEYGPRGSNFSGDVPAFLPLSFYPHPS